MNFKLVILLFSAILAVGLAQETTEILSDSTTESSDLTTEAVVAEESTGAAEESTTAGAEETGAAEDSTTAADDSTTAGAEDSTTAAEDSTTAGAEETTTTIPVEESTAAEDSTTAEASTSTTEAATTTTTPVTTTTTPATTPSTTAAPSTTEAPTFADNVNAAVQNLLGLNCMVQGVVGVNSITSTFRNTVRLCGLWIQNDVSNVLDSIKELSRHSNEVSKANSGVCRNSRFRKSKDSAKSPNEKCVNAITIAMDAVNNSVGATLDTANVAYRTTSNICTRFALAKFRISMNTFNGMIKTCAAIAANVNPLPNLRPLGNIIRIPFLSN